MLPVVQNNVNPPMNGPSSISHTPMEITGTPSEISNTIIPKHDTFCTVPKQVKDNNGVLPCVNVYISFENHSQQLSDLIRDQPGSIRDSPTVKQLSLLTKTDTSRYDYIANTREGSIIGDYRYDELRNQDFFCFSKIN